MAEYPEFLYEMTQRGMSETKLAIVNPIGPTVSATATTVSVPAWYTVPTGFILIVTSAAVIATGGAGQQPMSWQMNAQFTAANVNPVFAGGNFATTGGLTPNVGANNFGGPYLPSGSIISAQGSFNAGANANSVTPQLYGFLIPRGRIGF